MSDYKVLEKKQYQSHRNYPVSLDSYIINEDSNNKKFVILNFKSNKKDVLNNFKFKIIEFSEDNKQIKERTYELNDLNVKSFNKYIPLEKYEISSKTTSIVYELISADFEQSKFSEGEVQNLKTKVVKNEIFNYSFKKMIYPILIPILTIGLFVLSLSIKSYNSFEDYNNLNTFEYINSSEGLVITKYNGFSREVVIPSTIDSKDVYAIGSYAFESSNITSINFSGTDITIMEGAFMNSFYLTEVKGYNALEIGEEAFLNTFLLKTFTFNNVDYINNDAFKNSLRLRDLNIKNIENTVFSNDALNGMRLKGLKNKKGFTVYNNVLMGAPINNKTLVIDADIKFNKVSASLLEKLSRVEILEITNKDFVITKELFGFFPNLRKLDISRESRLSNNVFSNLSRSIEELTIPLYGNDFSILFSDISLYNIRLLNITEGRDFKESYMDSSRSYVRQYTIVD